MKLEQNYRSTANILNAANAVIANNHERRSKHLFTDGAAGAKIKLYQAQNERDEGRYIASEIERLTAGERAYQLSDFAGFYRTKAQSRVLEDMFLRAGVRYKIYGGTQFFARQEIRDVMAYLKLIVNPADDISAKRVINVPRRGIGKTSIAKIEELALREQTTFMDACELSLAEDSLGQGVKAQIGLFLNLIREAAGYQGKLRQIVELIVDRAGLIKALELENTDEAKTRIENINEFFGQVQEYDETHDPSELADAASTSSPSFPTSSPGLSGGSISEQIDYPNESGNDTTRQSNVENKLADFVEWLALRSDLDNLESGEDYVTLMTVHSAKGLEFPVVFIAGMEETIFPHAASSMEAGGVEEERRLAYVAITRAKKLLYLVYARTRSLFGQTGANPASRFVREIPSELCDREGVGASGFAGFNQAKRGDRHSIFDSGAYEPTSGRVFGSGAGYDKRSRKANSPFSRGSAAGRGVVGAQSEVSNGQESSIPQSAMIFKAGDRVDHKTFGPGMVIKAEGDKLTIRFDRMAQDKTLLAGYAPLVKVGS
jgi:DNA helicase-2/ATP-dependent DNA helicase PcrA